MRWAFCLEYGLVAIWLPERLTNEGLGAVLAFAVGGGPNDRWRWITG